jgi:hypothetical protein
MTTTYTAFDGTEQLASGPLELVLASGKTRFDQAPGNVLLIFEDDTGRQVDFDFRGTTADVLSRYKPKRAGVGRPKLGVVAREVTLLPRHWAWLEQQPAGASGTIRRLVEQARKQSPDAERVQRVIEATGRFLTAVAGNLPGFEEAMRALYARDWPRFQEIGQDWPTDVRGHSKQLLETIIGAATGKSADPAAKSSPSGA